MRVRRVAIALVLAATEVQEAFENSPQAVTAALPEHAKDKPLEIWFQE